MKVFTVIGARPQFIKAAVVSRAFKASRSDVHEVLVHTGQHYDANMSDIFFEELDIPRPNFNLGVGGGSHGQNTGRMLEKLDDLMQAEKPDWVLVYGDTDSTLAGALAAVKLHIPVAHVEAGLRSFNRSMPEEINRVLTDHASDLLFTPTETATRNLAAEGISGTKVKQVGDVMFDAALYYREHARAPSWFCDLGINEGDYLLATVHRAESTDHRDRLSGILKGLGGSEQKVILPLHPRTRAKLTSFDLAVPANICVVDPVGYLEMVWLEAHCTLVATDSGGVQKEAYFHGKPCVTLRDETEWVELVKGGWNSLAGTDAHAIVVAIGAARAPRGEKTLYGSGDSALKVVDGLR